MNRDMAWEAIGTLMCVTIAAGSTTGSRNRKCQLFQHVYGPPNISEVLLICFSKDKRF